MNIQVTIKQTGKFWRKPHDKEIINYNDTNYLNGWRYGGDGYRGGTPRTQTVGLPEVYRIKMCDQTTSIPPAWMWLWRNINPELLDTSFCTLLNNHLAWTNNTGFPGRKNVILGEDLDQKDPAFHAPIINGGALLQGTVGYRVTQTLRDAVTLLKNLVAGSLPSFLSFQQSVSSLVSNNVLNVLGMLNKDVPPSAQYVLNHHELWYWGTTVLPSGQVNYITRKGMDGQFHPVRVPILTTTPLWMPLSWLHELPEGTMPDARWMA